MIDVSAIKSLPELMDMKDSLNFFINKKIVADIYAEEDRDAIELETDRETAREILDQVLKQIEILSNRPKKKYQRKP